jgi:hypothetical protein
MYTKWKHLKALNFKPCSLLITYGRIILRWIIRKRVGRGIDWIDLAEDWDRWQALVNAAMNLWVS